MPSTGSTYWGFNLTASTRRFKIFVTSSLRSRILHRTSLFPPKKTTPHCRGRWTRGRRSSSPSASTPKPCLSDGQIPPVEGPARSAGGLCRRGDAGGAGGCPLVGDPVNPANPRALPDAFARVGYTRQEVSINVMMRHHSGNAYQTSGSGGRITCGSCWASNPFS